MELLVLGGTSFAGRHVVERALADGHSVTIFNRGKTNPALAPDRSGRGRRCGLGPDESRRAAPGR
jgi:uncharacterized protein YbjT (DUF2867 family)